MADLATTVTVIDAAGRAGVPVLLLSDPGMGKSSLIRGVAAAAGVGCEVVLGSIREPADLGGLPVVGESGVRLEAPAWAKRLAAARDGYLFLDELTTCPPSVQAAMLAVALDKTVGELRLPDAVRVVAGANPADRAADGYELAPPLANRFCHVQFAPSVEEWLDGVTTGWQALPASRATATDTVRVAAVRAAVTGFIKASPTALHVFPEDAAAVGGAWPSRRSWSMLMAALGQVRGDDHAAVQALTFGLVGEGVGVEFLSWCAHMDLPDPQDVIADPASVDWRDRPDRVWAILNGVVGHAVDQGTVEAWRSAWGPIVAAAKSGAPDVAAAAARPLGVARPARAAIPASVRSISGILEAAGLAA